MEEGYCTYTALNDNGIVNRNSKSFEIRHRSEMNRDVFSKAFDRTCQNSFDRLTQKKTLLNLLAIDPSGREHNYLRHRIILLYTLR